MKKDLSFDPEVRHVFKRSLPDVFLIDAQGAILSAAVHNRCAELSVSVTQRLAANDCESFLTEDNYVVRIVSFGCASDLRLVMVERLAVRDRMSAAKVQFELKPDEFEMLARLAAGASIREIADDLRITYASANSRARAVFKKTGTASSAELFRLLLGKSA